MSANKSSGPPVVFAGESAQMHQRIWRCDCGVSAPVPVLALGETATCRRCGTRSVVSLRNTSPVAPTPEPASGAEQTHCSRCRRPFRGEWDITARGDALLCDICARQATDGAVRGSAMPNGSALNFPHPVHAHARAGEETEPAHHEVITREDFEALFQAPPQTAQDHGPRIPRGYFKLIAATLAAALFSAATITYLLHIAPDAIDVYNGADATPLLQLIAERFISAVLINFAALYLSLRYLGELPNDTLTLNALTLGLVSFFLGALAIIGVNGYLAAMAIIIQLAAIKYLYDFSLRDFFLFSTLRCACGFAWSTVTYGLASGG